MTLRQTSIIVGLCFYSCTNGNVVNTVAQSIDPLQPPTDTTIIERNFNIDPSKTFGRYAKEYKPVQTAKKVNIDLPELNDTLKFAIDSLFKTDTSNLRVWTALILSKQFLHHLHFCNQSYEIRNGFDKLEHLDKERNPVLYAFLRLTNQLEIGSRNNEFLSSGFIHTYLQEHNELASNTLIKPYFDKIEKIEKLAEEQIKQNEAKKKNGY